MAICSLIRGFARGVPLALATVFAVHVAAAPTLPADVTQAVEALLETHAFETPYPVEYDIKPLDRRLRLKPCDTELTAGFRDARRTEGSTHVEVSCSDSVAPWRVHVSVVVRVWVDAVAATSPIARGATVTAADLELVKSERSRLYQGYFERIEDVVGLSAAMPLRNSQILNARHLRAPFLVNKGQRVTILARGGQIEIRAQGQALDNASQGQRVTVRNLTSGRVVDGVAVKRGTVQVPL
ncbi:MAG: flagellar basal body P-ring formation chaperone FlgA [Pseudomonadota bacterium]